MRGGQSIADLAEMYRIGLPDPRLRRISFESGMRACELACLHSESTFLTKYQIGEYRVTFGEDARLELERCC